MVCRYLCSLNSQRFSDTALSHSQLSSRGNFQGAAGWSNGNAHMGLNSLSRNYQGEVELGEGVFKRIYRKPGGAQLKPPEDEIACPGIR
jgi:hypothetical protein